MVCVCVCFVCLCVCCVTWVLVSGFHGVGNHVWVLVSRFWFGHVQWPWTAPTAFPRTVLPGTAQNFTFFLCSPAKFVLLSLSLWVLLIEFWWCLKRRDPPMCAVWSCKHHLVRLRPIRPAGRSRIVRSRARGGGGGGGGRMCTAERETHTSTTP